MTEHDIVVVGSGINALSAAALLARGGHDVALLERNEHIGGFIDSGEITEPGFTHDTYSSWHPLFVSGPVFAELGEDLARHGLRYRNTEDVADGAGAVTASVGADGRSVIAYRDPEATARTLAHTEDRAAYTAMIEDFVSLAPAIGAAMASDPRRPGGMLAVLDMLRRAGVSGAETLVRDVASSGRAYCARRFVGDEVDRLWIPWLLHNGMTPDSALGGFLTPVFAGSTHLGGLPVVEGGAANFVAAWRGLLDELGVTVVTGVEVDAIRTTGSGRRRTATGVTARVGGEREHFGARTAVLASVSPSALYGRLLGGAADPVRRRAATEYRPGRAAMQIHVSLDEPMRWHDNALDAVPLVHVADGSSTTAIACAQAQAGLLPAAPTVVVGRQHVLDPSRLPAGRGQLWVQLQEVPGLVRGDAAPEAQAIATPADGRWTPALARAYAERVLHRIAEHSPNLEGIVREIRVISPRDLEEYNPNAIGGDPYAGSAELDQELLWRPFPAGASGTGVRALHHIGAAVHPGPGLGGASGFRVAQQVLARGRRAERRERLAGAVASARTTVAGAAAGRRDQGVRV